MYTKDMWTVEALTIIILTSINVQPWSLPRTGPSAACLAYHHERTSAVPPPPSDSLTRGGTPGPVREHGEKRKHHPDTLLALAPNRLTTSLHRLSEVQAVTALAERS